MPTEITADGQVIPPRNITQPAPVLDTRAFQWRGLDTSSETQSADDHEEKQNQTPLVAINLLLPGQRVPPPSAQSLPTAPQRVISEEDMLRKQLGIDKIHEGRLPFPLEHFHGSYAGNGFNMIFRPNKFDGGPKVDGDNGINDNILELNLTTEQWTFGPTIGDIPNRGFGTEPTIILGGMPYLQTVQNVTNLDTGKGDSLLTNKPNGIHLEPGVFLFVPESSSTKGKKSIVRMASIPHGTTINAQGLVPVPNALKPPFTGKTIFSNSVIDTTPFSIGNPSSRLPQFFTSMNADRPNPFREPSDLSKFNTSKTGSGRITSETIKNPNKVLEKALEGQNITNVISFDLSTGPSQSKGSATLNGGGISNISFLNGPQSTITSAAPTLADNPNAHAEFFTNRWWVETVLYEVKLKGPLKPNETVREVWATMPRGSLAPTPVFNVTAPGNGVNIKGDFSVRVPGVQLQYSQTVNLNFGGLTWPHVSVATLVPTTPQPVLLPGPRGP
ncbi:hypothetical protein QBC37DRAFT_324034 [Rhypophila decipiens]|uniref:Uncharacterized protein n=1 Tax=Rhypophila decipiens TaxID=261697 RepID=A0AAN6XZD4_9PEZI|nr:hypothetical protein QBC37DRAFT_324034 [Rhypophila decipiens]